MLEVLVFLKLFNTLGDEVEYTFKLCSSTPDVNTTAAANTFTNSLAAGNDGGLNIISATNGVTGSSITSNTAAATTGSGANSLVIYSALFSFVLYLIM